MDYLDFRIVYCSCEATSNPATGLEDFEGWVSDARHQYPIELGIWVGDCTLEAVRLVARPALVPRRVDMYTALVEKCDELAECEAPLEVRRAWRHSYFQAIFTQLGTVNFEGSDKERHEGKIARPSNPVERCAFIRLVMHEPLNSVSGEHRVGLSSLAIYGRDVLCRLELAAPKLKLDASECALVAAGVPTRVVADVARRRTEKASRQDRVQSDQADRQHHGDDAMPQIQDAAPNGRPSGDSRAESTRCDRTTPDNRRPYARGVVFCHAWPIVANQDGTLSARDVRRTPPLDAVARAAACEVATVVTPVGNDSDDEKDDNDVASNDGTLVTNRPLTATSEPLQLFPGSDDAPSRELARLLGDIELESVSVRLVRWMHAERVADLESVAQALGQMHSVHVVSAYDRSATTSEDAVVLPETYRSDVLVDALCAALGPLALAFACQGNTSMRKMVLELARDGASRVDGPSLAAAADRAARKENDDVDAVFPFAAARQRRLLFAAICTLIEHGLTDPSAEVFVAATRLLVDVFSGNKGTLCARYDSEAFHRTSRSSRDDIQFIDAATRESFCVEDGCSSYGTVDAEARRPRQSYYLQPWQILLKGIRPRQSEAPLRETLSALRRLVPCVARRLAPTGSAAMRRRAVQTLAQLADIPWLGSSMIAAATLPKLPELDKLLLQSPSPADTPRLAAEAIVLAVSAEHKDTDSLSHRLRALAALVVRSSSSTLSKRSSAGSFGHARRHLARRRRPGDSRRCCDGTRWPPQCSWRRGELACFHLP